MLSTTNLGEVVRLVELDRRKRGGDVDAGCTSADRSGFRRSEQSRAYPEASGRAPDVNGRAMVLSVDPVRRKTQHLGLVAQLTNRNVKDFPAGHGVHVEVALYPSAPITHDHRRVIQSADRTNRIQVRSCDLLHIGEPCTANFEADGLCHGTLPIIRSTATSLPAPHAKLRPGWLAQPDPALTGPG